MEAWHVVNIVFCTYIRLLLACKHFYMTESILIQPNFQWSGSLSHIFLSVLLHNMSVIIGPLRLCFNPRSLKPFSDCRSALIKSFFFYNCCVIRRNRCWSDLKTVLWIQLYLNARWSPTEKEAAQCLACFLTRSVALQRWIYFSQKLNSAPMHIFCGKDVGPIKWASWAVIIA